MIKRFHFFWNPGKKLAKAMPIALGTEDSLLIVWGQGARTSLLLLFGLSNPCSPNGVGTLTAALYFLCYLDKKLSRSAHTEAFSMTKTDNHEVEQWQLFFSEHNSLSSCPLLGLQLLFQGRGTYSIVIKILALVTGLNGLLRR
jgi:hypothetical protein